MRYDFGVGGKVEERHGRGSLWRIAAVRVYHPEPVTERHSHGNLDGAFGGVVASAMIRPLLFTCRLLMSSFYHEALCAGEEVQFQSDLGSRAVQSGDGGHRDVGRYRRFPDLTAQGRRVQPTRLDALISLIRPSSRNPLTKPLTPRVGDSVLVKGQALFVPEPAVGIIHQGDGLALEVDRFGELAVLGEGGGEGVQATGPAGLGGQLQGASADFHGAAAVADGRVGASRQEPGQGVARVRPFGGEPDGLFQIVALAGIVATMAPAIGAVPK